MTEVELHRDSDAIRRIMILAHRGLGGEPLLGHLQEEDPGAAGEVFVLVPALSGA